VQRLACHKAIVHNNALGAKTRLSQSQYNNKALKPTHGFSPQKILTCERSTHRCCCLLSSSCCTDPSADKDPSRPVSKLCDTHVSIRPSTDFCDCHSTLLALFAGENGQKNEVLHVSAAGSASKEMTYATCTCTAVQQRLCIAAWLQHSSDIVLTLV